MTRLTSLGTRSGRTGRALSGPRVSGTTLMLCMRQSRITMLADYGDAR
ncbi:MAG: hypothetical protein H0T76_26230 [Nannocystis sp.]|nr:hypothetical protein [Nannocystis sp.]MBA3549992.1 hypothetical protein [Nannocystis sp.]